MSLEELEFGHWDFFSHLEFVIGHSSIVHRDSLAAIDPDAAVYRGQFYHRAAFAEFAVQILPDGKVFLGMAFILNFISAV